MGKAPTKSISDNTKTGASSKSGRVDYFDEDTKKKERLERRRQGMSRFALQEAEIASDEEGDDEEEELQRLEAEGKSCSQDSFINNNPLLSQHFSPGGDATDTTELFDYGTTACRNHAIANDHDNDNFHNHNNNHNYHRALDARREYDNQFKTPNFNRRMIRQQQPGSSSSDTNASSSQRGLGNMNFVRSILEHHRQGGDCDQIESYYNGMDVAEGEERRTPNDISPQFITAAAAVASSASAATANTTPTTCTTMAASRKSNYNQSVIDLSTPENNTNSTPPNTDPNANANANTNDSVGTSSYGGVHTFSTYNSDNKTHHEGRVVPTTMNNGNNYYYREATRNDNNTTTTTTTTTNATASMMQNNRAAMTATTATSSVEANNTYNRGITAATATTATARKLTSSNISGGGGGGGLTAEQMARIDANRQAALRRRKEFQAKNSRK